MPVLDEVESDRCARLRRREDRDRFATGCWLLRGLLAFHLEQPAASIALDRACAFCPESHGRPRLPEPEPGPGQAFRFSVTHAGARVGVALSREGERIVSEDGEGDGIGLDVEALDAASHLSTVTESMLAPMERLELNRHAADDRDRALLRRWVAKEAVLKAAGTGLRVEPSRVVLAERGDRLCLEDWPFEHDRQRVALHTLHPGDGYAGALAVVVAGHVRVREIFLDMDSRFMDRC